MEWLGGLFAVLGILGFIGGIAGITWAAWKVWSKPPTNVVPAYGQVEPKRAEEAIGWAHLRALPSSLQAEIHDADDGEGGNLYLTVEQRAELLVLDADGMPPVHIEGEWLVEDSTGMRVNVGNRELRALGLWTVRIRGTNYQDTAARIGRCDLVREPDNPYDTNAVAITQGGAKLGYFNRQMAVGLAKAIDTGEPIEAAVISAVPPKVIAASPAIMRRIGL